MIVDEHVERHPFMNCYKVICTIDVPNLYNGFESLYLGSLVEYNNPIALEFIKTRTRKNLLKAAYKVKFYFNKAKMKGIKISKKNKTRLLKELS